MISFRKAMPDDSSILAKLWKDFMHEQNNALLKLNHNVGIHSSIKYSAYLTSKAHFNSLLKDKNSFIQVAEHNGNIVAYSVSQIRKTVPIFNIARVGHFSDLYVTPKYRGRRITSKFKEEAIKWFKKRKIKEMSISVFVGNEPAHSIYKKWGFFDYHTEMRRKL